MENGWMDGEFVSYVVRLRDTHSALLDLPRYLDDRWGGSGVSLMKLLSATFVRFLSLLSRLECYISVILLEVGAVSILTIV